MLELVRRYCIYHVIYNITCYCISPYHVPANFPHFLFNARSRPCLYMLPLFHFPALFMFFLKRFLEDWFLSVYHMIRCSCCHSISTFMSRVTCAFNCTWATSWYFTISQKTRNSCFLFWFARSNWHAKRNYTAFQFLFHLKLLKLTLSKLDFYLFEFMWLRKQFRISIRDWCDLI